MGERGWGVRVLRRRRAPLGRRAELEGVVEQRRGPRAVAGVVVALAAGTISKSVTWRAERSSGSRRPLHLAVVKRSLCAVRAMVPPSARRMPYFCIARATTCAPAGRFWIG